MVKETYNFYASIGYNSNQQETVEIEFHGTETDEEKDTFIQEVYDDWLSGFADMYWYIVTEV